MGQALIDGDPHRLGDYWLAGRLGAGGQGVVYEAYDASGVRVAVKVLHGDPLNAAGLRARMVKEAAAAQRVASFCTARVLGADFSGERPYIVSEYVEGPTLRRAVSEGRVFAGDDLHRLATGIATAITAIHEAGVVHRDLKPDNVLLGPDGPRVIDFGVARTLEMSLTSTGIAAGTPTYMAPEVFTGARAGMPADVFAWGAIVLFAATGRDPFQADSLGAVMHRVLSVDPDLSPLPPSLRGLVGAALAKEPTGRPSAPELLISLVSGGAGLDMPRMLAEGSRAAAEVGQAVTADPALGTLAEDSYAVLSPAERELVPEIFLRLVTVRDDGELSVRRAAREELFGGRPPDEAAAVERVLGVFSYLLTTGDEIALSRPALPHAWPRMRAWVRANRDGLAVHRQIALAARRWTTGGRRDADLIQGATLDDALRWAATERRNITLTPVERDFLDAAAALTRRKARRDRMVTVTLAVLLVAALVAGGVAVWQSRVAALQRDESEARRIAVVADGLRATDPVVAMLLSVAAWRISPVTEARAALIGALTQPETRVFRDPAAQGIRRLSRDGRVLVSIGDDRVRAWDVRTGRRVGGVDELGTGVHQILDAELSPSGKVLAVATAEKGVRLWDLRTGRPLPRGYPLGPESAQLQTGITYGNSEDVLAVHIGEGEAVWNSRTGQTGWAECCHSIAVPDGSATVTAALSGDVVRTAFPSGRRVVLEKCGGCRHEIALSRDGRMLAVADEDDLITLNDPMTGKQRGEPMQDWNGGTLEFSPDGALLASTTATEVQVFRVADRAMVLRHAISASQPDLAFDPDGHSARVLDGDTVVTLDLTGLAGYARPRWSALAPGGRLLASWDPATGGVRLGEPLATGGGRHTGRTLGRKPSGAWSLSLTAFSPDGRALAAGGSDDDGTEIVVWDTGTGAEQARITGLPSPPDSVAFSPDGRRLVSVTSDVNRPVFLVDLWDLDSGERLWRVTRDLAREAAFTPDGRTVLVRGDDAMAFDVAAFDAATGEPRGPATLGGASRGVRFGSGGVLYAAGDAEGSLTMWVPGSPAPVEVTLRGSTRDIAGLAAAPVGGPLATVARDGTVAVWDRATGALLGRVSGPPVAITDLAFSADAARLLILDANGGLGVHRLRPGDAAAEVCARAGRGLSEKEWRAHLPGLPYREVCRL